MKNAIDILVDISDNMEGCRQKNAQNALLDEILPMVDFSEITGMKTFMAACGTVPLVIRSVDLGQNARSEFEQKIKSLPLPNGGTPISEAINESLKELKKQEATKKRIVIVTCGADTLAGSYARAVTKAASEGVQVSFVLVGADGRAISAAQAAAAEAKGACCCIDGDAYDSFAVRDELKKLSAALADQTAAAEKTQTAKEEPKREETKTEQPKQTDFISGVKEAVSDLASAVHDKLQEGGVIDIDDFKSTLNNIGSAVSDILQPAKDDLKAAFAGNAGGNDGEKIDLNEIIAKNKESLAKLQDQASESINLLMDSCAKAIADLQDKASKRISELMDEHNSSAANLMQKSAEAFDQLSKEKDNAEARVSQLIAEDKAVVVHTNTELSDKVELKSQQYLNAHLQKKYPGRVKWMNENGDALKGFDFVVDDNDTANNTYEYVIACKGILDDSRTFFLREREWKACVCNARNYQVYVISNMQSNPTLTVIDNLMDAIATGKVVPCAEANTKLKAGHVVLTIK